MTTTNSVETMQLGDWLEAAIHRHADSVEIDGIGTISAATSDSELEAMASRIDIEARAVSPSDAVVIGSALPELEALRARCARCA